jgi:hypothetical protein
MTLRLWLAWSLPAVLAVQLLLMLVASGPDSHWRGDGYVAASAIASLLATAAALWSLRGLRSWPVALRVTIVLLHAPLLAGALLMSGF